MQAVPVRATERGEDVRCANCNAKQAAMLAPGGYYVTKCHRCRTLVGYGTTPPPRAAGGAMDVVEVQRRR